MVDNVKLNFSLDVTDNKVGISLKGIQNQANKTQKQFNGISGSFSKIGAQASGVGGRIAGFAKSLISIPTAIVGIGAAFAGMKIVQAAMEQEKAINSLNSALAQTGRYTEEASKDLQNFASAMQRTSKFGDEVVLKNAALLQSIANLDTQGLKRATKAAIDLSSALGIDLESATRLVGKAAEGQTDALRRYGITVQKGRDNAESFANTLTALESKFGGRAQSEINTFSGAVTQLGNTFGDLLEVLGDYIIKNPVILELTKSINSIMLDLQDNLKGSTTASSALSETIIGLTKVFSFLVDALDATVRFFKLIGNTIAIITLPMIGGLVDAVALLISGISTLYGKFGDNRGLEATAKVLEDIKNKIYATARETQKDFSIAKTLGGDTALKKIADSVDNITTKLEKVKSKEVKLKVNNNEANSKIDETVAKAGSLGELLNKAKDFNISATFSSEGLAKMKTDFIKNLKDLPATSLNLVLQGAEGANKLFASAAGAFGDALIPGLGPVIGELAGALAKGPEFVKEMVMGFINQIPVIIENVILAIPVLIESIVVGLSDMITSLIDRIDEIVISFINSLVASAPKIITSLAMAMPLVATQLALQMPNVAIALIDGLVAGAPKFIEELIKQLTDKLKGAFGGGKGGFLSDGDGLSGAIKKIGVASGQTWLAGAASVAKKVFKFADGGQIAKVPSGYPNDTYPSFLSSRELVVDQSLTSKLENFLNKQGGGGESNVLMARIISLLERPMEASVVSSTLDQNVFAQQLIRLNRANIRTA